jgi:ATP-dependent Clp protease protease subunit
MLPPPDGLADRLAAALFDRRTVRLSGPIDETRATEVGAALMTLDALGDGAVELHLDSPGGTVGASLALVDVIDLLGVPVRARCTGLLSGPAVAVLAVCDHRTAAPHASLRLHEPAVELTGTARDLEGRVAAHRAGWAAWCTRVGAAVGRPADEVAADAAAGRFLTPPEAVAYGLVDEVAGAGAPGATVHRLPGRPLGFRPEGPLTRR